MITDEYRLILNHITGAESILNRANPKGIEEYLRVAYLFLNQKEKHLFKEDILSLFREGITLERIFEQDPSRFAQGTNRKKDGKLYPTWYDLWSMEEIANGDNLFDYFFACKLRHLSLLNIDAFLEFHLGYSFENDLKKYTRFLNIVIREYKDTLLNENTTETVKEWMVSKEKETTLQGTEREPKIKGKIKRERDDKLTKLNQEQTAMLIYCLRETKVILKDEYLNNSEAGFAFSILTGYSAETLRQNLNLSEKANIATKKNTDILLKALQDLQNFVKDKLEPES